MRRRIPLPEQLREKPFTSREALLAGVTPSRLRGDDIAHPFQGVHSIGVHSIDVHSIGEPDTLVDRCIALATKLPPHAFFCGPTAAIILGVPLPLSLRAQTTVHVAVPAGHRTLVGRGIRGHTYQVTETRVHRPSSLTLTTPARLLCELAVPLSIADLVAAGDFLIHRRSPLATLEELSRAAELNHDARGNPTLRSALPLLNDASESPQESLLRLIMTRAGIEGWVANLPISTRSGHHYRADFAFPSRKLIIEYQSYLHEGSDKFRADMTRISRLQADEWFALLVNGDDMRNPTELAQRIQHTLNQRPHF